MSPLRVSTAVACLATLCISACQDEQKESDSSAVLEEQELPLVNYTDYYPTPSCTSDVTSQLQTLLNNQVATKGGGVLYLPKGCYRISTQLNVGDVPVTFKGDGKDQTIIKQYAANAHGIVHKVLGNVFSSGGIEQTNSLEVVDLTLACAAPTCGAAVLGSWTETTMPVPFFQARNVKVTGADDWGFTWRWGFVLSNVNGSRMSHVDFLGGSANVGQGIATARRSAAVEPYRSEAAIRLTNQNNTAKINHFWDGVSTNDWNTSIDIEGWYEGIYLNNFELVNNTTGIRFRGAGKAVNLFVEEGHVNFRKNGLFLSDVNNVQVRNVDFYKDGETTAAISSNLIDATRVGWLDVIDSRFSVEAKHHSAENNGLRLQDCNHGSVTGCGFANVTSRGIWAWSATDYLITDNRIVNSNVGVELGGLTTGMFAHDNQFIGNAPRHCYDFAAAGKNVTYDNFSICEGACSGTAAVASCR